MKVKITNLEKSFVEHKNRALDKLSKLKVESDDEIEGWRQRLFDSEKKRTVLLAENESLRAKMVNVEKIVDILKEESGSLKRRFEQVDSQLTLTKKEKGSLREKLLFYEKEIVAKEKLLSDNHFEAMEEINELKQKLIEKDAENSKLNEQLVQATTLISGKSNLFKYIFILVKIEYI